MEYSPETEKINSIKVTFGKDDHQKDFDIPVYYDNASGEDKIRCKIPYLDNLLRMFDRQSRELTIKEIHPETFQFIINYMEKHQWNPVIPQTPIKSGRLSDNLCKIDYDLFKQFDYKDTNTDELKNPTHLKNIYSAANYLRINALCAIIVVRISTEFYFGNDLISYENLKKKHQIEQDLTIEEEVRIKKWYSFQ